MDAYDTVDWGVFQADVYGMTGYGYDDVQFSMRAPVAGQEWLADNTIYQSNSNIDIFNFCVEAGNIQGSAQNGLFEWCYVPYMDADAPGVRVLGVDANGNFSLAIDDPGNLYIKTADGNVRAETVSGDGAVAFTFRPDGFITIDGKIGNKI